jgi:MFS family permease
MQVTIPLYGSLSEVFGRKTMINIAILLFATGSILCGTAKTMAWLIAARAIQGCGAGGNLSLVSVIITDMTGLKERGIYMSLLALAWAIGVIGGASTALSVEISTSLLTESR